nr:MAG: capsid protein [Genomoviridae sp.]
MPRYRRNRRMTKKKILNVTSEKKRNGMVSMSNTSDTGSSRALAVAPLFVNGNNGNAVCVFNATAQDMNINDSGNIGSKANTSTRTATSCYIRGLSEHLRIETNSAVPWMWRRIVFRTKDAFFSSTAKTATEVAAPQFWTDTSAGMERVWFNLLVNAISAPTDNLRITVMYDKTRIIRSGNNSGVLLTPKMWHGYNGTLVYDDDEDGGAITSAYTSTDSNAGKGDMIIVDYFVSSSASVATDQLKLQSSSTLYWHER